jgi:peptidoglycan/LPS O-acetylase OafA/YrhL
VNGDSALTLKHRIPALDGLRGLALLLVLFLHFRAPDLVHPWKGILGLGWVGVQLFFVLSGFLITGILLDTRQAPNYFSTFWIRRVLRIFPLYFAALAMFLFAFPTFVALGDKYLPNQPDRIYYWMYLNNWVPLPADGRLEHVLGHFWSLAVEEQFYLVWPVVVWLLPARRLFRWCGAACLLVLAARTSCIWLGWDPAWIYRNTVLRSDALMMGAMAAVLVREPTWVARLRPWLKAALGSTGVASLAVMAAGGGTHYLHPPVLAAGMTVFAAAFAVVLTVVVTAPRGGGFLEHPVLGWFGRHSYGMYVWHWPLAYALYYSYPEMGLQKGTGQIAVLVAGLAGSSLLGWLSYELYEKPFLRLKQYFQVQTKPVQERAFFTASVSAGTTSNRSPTMP